MAANMDLGHSALMSEATLTRLSFEAAIARLDEQLSQQKPETIRERFRRHLGKQGISISFDPVTAK